MKNSSLYHALRFGRILSLFCFLAHLPIYGAKQPAVNTTFSAFSANDTTEVGDTVLIKWTGRYFKLSKVNDSYLVRNANPEASILSQEDTVQAFIESIKKAAQKRPIKLTYHLGGSKKEYRWINQDGKVGPVSSADLEADKLLARIASSEEGELEELKLALLYEKKPKLLEMEEIKETVTERIRGYEKQEGQEDIGAFFLKPEFFEGIDQDDKKFTDLHIEINDGFITRIYSRAADDKIYSLERKHITSVANLPRKFENDALELKHGSDIVKLSKCVSFIPGTGVGFEPDDQYIHLHEGNREARLKQTYTLNTIIDARIYTDFRALLGYAPNGILNFEFKSKLPLNHKNYKRGLWFGHITPTLRYSRYDEGKNSAIIQNDEIGSPLSIFQESKLNAGFDIGIYRTLKGLGRFDLRIEGLFDYLITDLYNPDGEVVAEGYNSMYSALKINFQINKNSHFQFDLSPELGWLWAAGATPINNFDSSLPILGLNAEVSYHPDPKSLEGFYLRYGSFDDLTSRKGDYTFIQFGYRIGIGEAWSKTTGT